MKLDLWMLDKLDTFTTKLQRKGILLTSVHVHVAGVVFVTTVMSSYLSSVPNFMVPFAGAVWGINLYGTMKWASKNKDYPSLVRIREQLNSFALRQRETMLPFRVFWWVLVIVGIPAEISWFLEGRYTKAAFNVAQDASLLAMIYLNGCFFIGPGEFAKQTKDRHVSNAIPQTF